MYLFSRQAVLSGPVAESIGWASEIRAYASNAIGKEIALWSTVFGGPIGSVGWAIRVDGLAEVAANGQTLLADAGYHALLAKGADFIGAPGADTLIQPLHGELAETAPPVGALATVTTATIAGSIGAAVTWGVEVAQLVEGIADTPVLFGTSGFGNFLQVVWIGVSADAAAADATNAKITASAEYLEKLEGGAGLFLPGSANRVLLTRID